MVDIRYRPYGVLCHEYWILSSRVASKRAMRRAVLPVPWRDFDPIRFHANTPYLCSHQLQMAESACTSIYTISRGLTLKRSMRTILPVNSQSNDTDTMTLPTPLQEPARLQGYY